MEELQYHEQRDLKNKKKLQELLAALPPFCADFFRGIEPATSSMTRLSYAYDISTFFDFLRKLKPELEKLSVENISLEQLCAVTIQDLERYLEYLKYRPDDPEHKNVNKEQGIKRKFFSLKKLMMCFCLFSADSPLLPRHLLSHRNRLFSKAIPDPGILQPLWFQQSLLFHCCQPEHLLQPQQQ